MQQYLPFLYTTNATGQTVISWGRVLAVSALIVVVVGIAVRAPGIKKVVE